MQNVPYASDNPSDLHRTTVKNILKYLITKDMFLVYESDMKRELSVSCYTDVGYLTDADDLKSQTEYVFVLNRGVVDWKSFKQSIFATTSAEAEYIAAYDASKEAVWVRKFISGLGITKGARHFHAKVHYLHEVIEYGDIKLEKVHTYDNLDDHFTKAVAFPKHSEHTNNIGMLLASSLMDAYWTPQPLNNYFGSVVISKFSNMFGGGLFDCGEFGDDFNAEGEVVDEKLYEECPLCLQVRELGLLEDDKVVISSLVKSMISGFFQMVLMVIIGSLQVLVEEEDAMEGRRLKKMEIVSLARGYAKHVNEMKTKYCVFKVDDLHYWPEYDLRSMRMEQYLTFTDHALWEVIVNDDSVTAVALASAEGPIPPKTAERKLARKMN
nr:hypothetical protein [Tanacetum cinerariifolium]